MSYNCEYCDATFTKQYSMYKHQRTAKYCLALQNKGSASYKCLHCDKEFNRRDIMQRHQKKCAEQTPPPDPKELKIQLDDLMKLMTKLADRPLNVVMNLPPITEQGILDHLAYLTVDYIHDGGKGYANFAGSYPFKDRILCTDKSRKKLRYKDPTGQVIEDGGGLKLTQRFFQTIAPRNEELINTEYQTLHHKVQYLVEQDKVDTDTLTELITKASHLQDLLSKCQEAAKGGENELTKEFVNYLSKML